MKRAYIMLPSIFIMITCDCYATYLVLPEASTLLKVSQSWGLYSVHTEMHHYTDVRRVDLDQTVEHVI